MHTRSPDARSPRALVVTAVALSCACAPISRRLTPDPAPPGVVEASFGVDGLYFRDTAVDSSVPSLMFDAGARYGVADDVDLGLRVYTLGVEASVKWRLLDGPMPVAIAPAVSVAGTRETNSTSKALFFFADLPLVAGVELAKDVRLGFGPRLLYGYQRPVNGGAAHGLGAGGFLNLDLAPTGGWHLIPEISVAGTLAGEVPVHGLSAAFGVGVVHAL
ncbi:hypothetical protein L6R52_11450 [Myxococcota bacterium]|nr:hypothetical protein [Myxococcota bacterium]